MNRITVPNKIEIESQWKETTTITGDTGEATLVIRVDNTLPTLNQQNYAFLGTLIPQILGFATPGNVRVIYNGYAWTSLARRTPAVHPRYPYMRATKILDIEGVGTLASNYQWGQTIYGEYKTYMIRIQFEALPYPVIEDTSPFTGLNAPIGNTGPEYARWTEWKMVPSVQNSGRKGTTWRFENTLARNVFPPAAQSFPGDVVIRTQASQLVIIWHDVPLQYFMLNSIWADNIASGIGYVNRYPFPKNPVFPLSPSQLTNWQAQPGTLLMLPPKITIKNQVAALATLAPDLSSYFAKTADIEFTFTHFDPVNDENSIVYWTDNSTIRIQGHNLVPLPRPSITGNSWYAVTNGPITPNAIVNPVIIRQENLIYPYYDFEQLFLGVKRT